MSHTKRDLHNNIFSQIKFDKKHHTYELLGKQLTPVTKFISQFEPEVDWDTKVKDVVIREGVKASIIRKRWDEAKEAGANKGSEVHEYIEQRLLRHSEKSTKYPEMMTFDNFWQSAKEHMLPMKVEWIIGDYDLNLGGTVDCFFFSHKTGLYHPFDWKTNKNFTMENRWHTLKPPFDDLDASDFVKYSLQISTYGLILRRNLDIQIGDGYIFWLGGEPIKALDLSDRIENFLR